VPPRRYFSDYGRPARATGGPNVVPYILVAALAAAGLFYLHNTPAPVPTTPPQTLTGTLVDATNGVPLSGVIVGVRDSSAPGSLGIAQSNGAGTPGAGITGVITVAGVMTGTLPPSPAPPPGAAITATTDTAGMFHFAALPPNPLLVIQKEGYAPQ
jgi:hypothetical protein